MFSGSVFDLKPGTEYEVRLSLRDPDGVDGESRVDSDGAHARGAAAGRRRQGLPRVSGRLRRAEAGAVVHGSHGRVLHGRRALRLPERVPAARAARRPDPRARGRVSLRSAPLHEPRAGAGLPRARDRVRRHVLPDAERDAGTADRDQRRRRRRGRVRRRRRREPVQSDGRELPVLRGHHGPQHERRVPAGQQEHRGRERLHAETLASDERRPRRADGLVGIEGLLHRRQRRSSAATIRRR